MYKHLETAEEKNIRRFAKRFCHMMEWDNIKVSRFKYGRMLKYRGYCMVLNNEEKFIIISNSPAVYHDNRDNILQLWHCVAHELIHLKIYLDGYGNRIAFNHGKTFLRYCKEVEVKSKGFFSANWLMK